MSSHPCKAEEDRFGQPALSQSIWWSHQAQEPGLFPAPKLSNVYLRPGTSTREKSANPSEEELGCSLPNPRGSDPSEDHAAAWQNLASHSGEVAREGGSRRGATFSVISFFSTSSFGNQAKSSEKTSSRARAEERLHFRFAEKEDLHGKETVTTEGNRGLS